MIFAIFLIIFSFILFLIKYLKLNKNFLFFILVLGPLFQPLLVALRFLLNKNPKIVPTIIIDIQGSDSVRIMFFFLVTYVFLFLPFSILIKRLKISIIKESYENIVLYIKNNPFSENIIFFLTPFYPLWSIAEFYNFNTLSVLSQFGVRLFGAVWFFVPFIKSSSKKLIIFLVFLISVYPSFLTGNRTCTTYPLVILALGLITKRYFLNGFRFKKKILTVPRKIYEFFFIFISGTVFSYFSILIRFNRNFQINNLSDLLELRSTVIPNNQGIFSPLIATFDRLVQWPLITSQIYKPALGFDGMWREFFHIFSDKRQDMLYMITNDISLGLPRLIGVDTYYGFSFPVTAIVEGSMRFGYFGAVFFYIIQILILIITILIINRFLLDKLLSIIYVLTNALIQFNADSIYQVFKNSLYFIIFAFLYKLIYIATKPKI